MRPHRRGREWWYTWRQYITRWMTFTKGCPHYSHNTTWRDT